MGRMIGRVMGLAGLMGVGVILVGQGGGPVEKAGSVAATAPAGLGKVDGEAALLVKVPVHFKNEALDKVFAELGKSAGVAVFVDEKSIKRGGSMGAKYLYQFLLTTQAGRNGYSIGEGANRVASGEKMWGSVEITFGAVGLAGNFGTAFTNNSLNSFGSSNASPFLFNSLNNWWNLGASNDAKIGEDLLSQLKAARGNQSFPNNTFKGLGLNGGMDPFSKANLVPFWRTLVPRPLSIIKQMGTGPDTSVRQNLPSILQMTGRFGVSESDCSK